MIEEEILQEILRGYKHAIEHSTLQDDGDYFGYREGDIYRFFFEGWRMAEDVHMSPWMFGHFFWRARNGLLGVDAEGDSQIGQLVGIAKDIGPTIF